MLGLSLHTWEDLMLLSLGSAALAAVFVIVATFAVVRLQRQETAAAKQDLDLYKVEAGEKISAANSVGETAKAEAEKARADAANAKEETAKANKATEEIRRQNLELQEAVAPRSLEQVAPSDVLKAFPGITVYMGVVPEYESRRFAQALAFMFNAAGWKVEPLPSKSAYFQDGVSIEYSMPVRSPRTPADEMRQQAAMNVTNELKQQKISANHQGIPDTTAGDSVWGTVPRDALIVKVGAKPSTYFLEQRYPDMRARREWEEQMMRDARERFRQAFPNGVFPGDLPPKK